MEKVFISETSTSAVANASPTVASKSSDIWGMAVKVCECLHVHAYHAHILFSAHDNRLKMIGYNFQT